MIAGRDTDSAVTITETVVETKPKDNSKDRPKGSNKGKARRKAKQLKQAQQRQQLPTPPPPPPQIRPRPRVVALAVRGALEDMRRTAILSEIRRQLEETPKPQVEVSETSTSTPETISQPTPPTNQTSE